MHVYSRDSKNAPHIAYVGFSHLKEVICRDMFCSPYPKLMYIYELKYIFYVHILFL